MKFIFLHQIHPIYRISGTLDENRAKSSMRPGVHIRKLSGWCSVSMATNKMRKHSTGYAISCWCHSANTNDVYHRARKGSRLGRAWCKIMHPDWYSNNLFFWPKYVHYSIRVNKPVVHFKMDVNIRFNDPTMVKLISRSLFADWFIIFWHLGPDK